MIRPIIIKQDNKNEPPADINGNGKPFTGIIPVDIAVLTKTCAMKIVPIPMRTNPGKRSFAKNASFTIFSKKSEKMINIIEIVINPNSSPITETIKSDS
jgi:hypothetical protein